MTAAFPEWGTPERRALAQSFSAEIIAALAAEGVAAEIWPTGGGCMAIQVDMSEQSPEWTWDEILITDGDAALPDGMGGYVDRRRIHEDTTADHKYMPTAVYLSTEEPTTVPQFVAAVLAAVRADEPIEWADW